MIARLNPRTHPIPARRALLGGLVLTLVWVLGAPEPGAAEPARPDWVQTLPQLVDDPVGAQQVLLASGLEHPAASDAAGRLPRVSALVQEWVWQADEQWLDDVGVVLETAATPDSNREPDAAAPLIMQALVTAVADATHSPIAGGVPDRLRPTLGRLAAAYLPDLHLVIDQEDLDTVSAGILLRHLTPRQAGLFLAEAGHHEQARNELFGSIEEYAAEVFAHLLSLDGPDDDPKAAMQMFGVPRIAGLVAAVDAGATRQIYLETGKRHVGLAHFRASDLTGASRKMLVDWVMLSYYGQLEPDDLPEPTRGALTGLSGELIPMETWLHQRGSPEYAAWKDYLGGSGAASPPVLLADGMFANYFAVHDRVHDALADAEDARGGR